MLSTLFLLCFSLLGYGLFNDIDQFSSYTRSFNEMYMSVFGAFDFAIYANSTITAEYYGRIFIGLFLLIFVVLVMNFLIAILSEVYSNFNGFANALQKREIIKLRALYEPHKHYYCLVKTPVYFNFYMLLLAPLVVIFKSEKLNKLVFFLHYSIVLMFYEIGAAINFSLLQPVLAVAIIYIRISNLK